ncbi:NAD(P)H-dependent oxidoreductase [Streptomyces sp. cmx-4-9]|uniref:NAD(P)H-dependent oxidoreductase n=1 Tax=Streptomyces sp. cmx-4-9 TaxID=2790941 RepID=UPI00397FEE14
MRLLLVHACSSLRVPVPAGGRMRIAVYLAHPRAGSFNHAVFDAVVEELRGRGAEVVAHDLCAEGFPAVLTADETGTVEAAEAAQDAQVAQHRAEVAAVDGMVFVHPNWWGMPPAVLTGWVQRVLVPGVAYKLGAAEGSLPDYSERAGRSC